MRAVVWRGIGDIAVEDVPEPKIEEATDAIVRLTASAICGTDLHFIRGTMPGMKKGTILGHEGVGVIEELGDGVRNFNVGDRVVIPSTIACGNCSYCRSGYYAQCDEANPSGETAFFGGPESAGGFQGLQAEKARVPYANVGLVKLPDEISDDQAILLSDIFPTGWMGAENAQIKPGNSVVVFGCGPVGQFAIASARLMGAGRVFAVDQVPSRLDMARAQGAEVIDFSKEDPVATLKELMGGSGPDRAIDAVGMDAERPDHGPAAKKLKKEGKDKELDEELARAVPKQNPHGDNWHPGDAPSLALQWAVEALAKAGTLSIIGVYGMGNSTFPIGAAMNKNLTVNMGNCNHRRYIPKLIELVMARAIDPSQILTQRAALADAVSAYEAFDRRLESWIKVELQPVQ
ncbi:MAG: oxidoreductase, zinc-binding dehydrogenase family [Myxococcales bacterium]|nr:oxidoreductase, zinc-binding dehydrogenase family [Myxococcales bacterium]